MACYNHQKSAEREEEKRFRREILERAQALNERMRRRMGGNLDLLEALDRSREGHP